MHHECGNDAEDDVAQQAHQLGLLDDQDHLAHAQQERGTLIEARLTQQELAEMIGTTRETLAHTLGDFLRRGLLDTDRHQVLIRDAELLAEIADGDEL